MELTGKLRSEVEALRIKHQKIKEDLRLYHYIYYVDVRPFFMRSAAEEIKEQLIKETTTN